MEILRKRIFFEFIALEKASVSWADTPMPDIDIARIWGEIGSKVAGAQLRLEVLLRN